MNLKGNNRNRQTKGFDRTFLKHLAFTSKKHKRHSFSFMLGLKLAARKFENPETNEDLFIIHSLFM